MINNIDAKTRMLFGVAGWDYPDWKHIVYPKNVKDKLAFLAYYVDIIEINSTFYSIPSVRSVTSWMTSAIEGNRDILFSIKLHHNYTHRFELITEQETTQFLLAIEPVIETKKLFCILAQFKYDFAFSEESIKHIQKIRNLFASMNMVFEFRHSSWQQGDAIAFIRRLEASIAHLDWPANKKNFNFYSCDIGHINYLRLHGRNSKAWFDKKAGRDETYNYFYNEKELNEIKVRIDFLAKSNNPVAIIANNHFRGKAIANILQLKAAMLGKQVEIPPNLMAHYPILKNVALNKISELSFN